LRKKAVFDLGQLASVNYCPGLPRLYAACLIDRNMGQRFAYGAGLAAPDAERERRHRQRFCKGLRLASAKSNSRTQPTPLSAGRESATMTFHLKSFAAERRYLALKQV